MNTNRPSLHDARSLQIRNLRRYVLQHPSAHQELRTLARLLLEQGSYEDALQIAERYIRVTAYGHNPELMGDARAMCANAYYHLGSYDFALATANAAVEADTANSEGWEIMALCYYHMGALHAALTTMELALSRASANNSGAETAQRRENLAHLITLFRREHCETYGLCLIYDSGEAVSREELCRPGTRANPAGIKLAPRGDAPSRT